MSGRTHAVREPAAAAEVDAAKAPPRRTQPFRWSLRRELWENRAIYLAPLGVGGSMPVSDLATVLAKASVPLAVLPLITFAVIVAAHVILFLLSVVALALNGHGPGALWRELQFFRIWPALLYAAAAMALWHAPIHGFLMLVSGWARRTAVLWAVLPLLAVGVLEKLIFDTTGVAMLALHRLVGWYHQAFLPPGPEHVPFDVRLLATPGEFLAAPGLWIGLALASLFLAAAVRMRRLREPV